MNKKLINQKASTIYALSRKIPVAMRITLVLLFAVFFTINAEHSYSQSAKISLEMKNSTVEKVLQNIEQNSDYYFLYNSRLIDVDRKVSVRVKDAAISAVLHRLFDAEGVDYEVKGSQIILSPKSVHDQIAAAGNLAQQQQKRRIAGTVVDVDGEPIIGANIIEKGTTNGTVTDVDGKFVLEVSDRATLQISYIGYLVQETGTTGRSSLNITLIEDTKTLDELVVTALGIKREEKALGYSVQAVQGDVLQTVKGVDMATSLTGKVAGLMVKNSTEFSEAPNVQIRGENPLLVIDGVPYANMTLRDISSDDIESISVLKGATASALYGYRGGSGAIMVTTKLGLANKGLSVSFNSGSMFTAGFLAIPESQSTYGRSVKTNAEGALEYVRTADGSWGMPLDGREVIQWDPISKSMKRMPFLPVGKDNFRNFLEQGYILNNNLSIAQQGEFGSFRTSATWVKNKGQYPNSMFDKISFGIGGDMKFDKFSLTSAMSYNKQTTPNKGFSGYTGYDPMYSLLIWAAPDYDIRDYRDYWLIPNEVQNSSFTAGNNNPYFDRYERTHSLNRDIFNGSLSLDYKFSSWLKATMRTGFDTYSNKQAVTISKGSFQGGGNAKVIIGGDEVWGESMKGSYNVGQGRGYSINNDLILFADKSFGDFRIDGFVGGSLYYQEDDGIEARTQGGLSIPGFYSLKASINPAKVTSSVSKRQVNSLYGRIGLSWKNMIYMESTLRNDWSSTLPESTRSYLYPSFSGSFIASEVLPKMDWLSLWKLRGSWTLSKTPAGIFDINSVYSITSNAWGSLSSATLPGTIRGSDLRPESAATTEFGSMVSVFENRLSLDVAYYQKRMYDFIRSAGVSPSSGYTSNMVNLDEEITRKGIEVTLNATPVKTRDWAWDASFNWSKYARYYTKLDEQFSADKPWVAVGERVDHYIIRDYQYDPQGNIIHNNGLSLYSGYDSKFGYSDPDWIWGIASSLKFKDFTFNISFDGRVGGLAQTTTEMYMWRAGSHPNSVVPERMLDATQPGTKNYIGKGVKVVSGAATYDTYGNITSDTREYAPNDVPVTYKAYLEAYHKGTAWGGAPSPVDAYSTTFLKIREISLTYDLPESVYSKFYSKGASISAVGQNVFLWAKQFKYSDPDGGIENFSDPSLRYLGFNLKVTF